MAQRRLNLYTLDMKYVRDLAKIDDRVMSVSPQLGKQRRPFVGIVIVCDDKRYCIPLSSPKAKHYSMKNASDFSKIIDKNGKLIGVINFNNMIPVTESAVRRINLSANKNDDPSAARYKALLNDQLDWCNDNSELIVRKANRLYELVTEHPERSRNLVRRCCDFKRLEAVLEWPKRA